ncbi:MAG: hypothetical protein PHX04_01330 [Bacilli bacterium]|nr:hypothetical protein [Bacilli bacterium]
MYKKDYEFENITFTVQANNYEDFNSQLRHISQFYISLSEFSNYSDKINIKYVVDVKLYEELKNKIKGKKARLYQSFENQIHAEYSMENNTKIYLIDTEEYICIKYGDNDYETITDGRKISERWLFRVVREILVRKNEEKKGLFMHGTGLVLEDQGILILGNSGAGKTTLATRLLSGADCEKQFLSNDRVFLYSSGNESRMEYFPIPVVLASGTVKNNLQLNEYFEKNNIYENKTGKPFDEAPDNAKIDIPLTDISEIFDKTSLIPIHKIDLIIFSKLNLSNNDGLTSNYLSAHPREVGLSQTCFTTHDWESLRMEWIYKRKIKHDQIIEDRIVTLNNLSESVPIIHLNFGVQTKTEDIVRLIKKYY